MAATAVMGGVEASRHREWLELAGATGTDERSRHARASWSPATSKVSAGAGRQAAARPPLPEIAVSEPAGGGGHHL